jgi:hypothetical protein
MLILGALDVLEGIIAVSRGKYYVLTANQIIVFDLKTWGWITLIWGVVIGLAGFGVLAGSAIARWFAIVVASLTIIEQLAFDGSSAYPLWALTVVALCGVVIYALIARWGHTESPAGDTQSPATV